MQPVSYISGVAKNLIPFLLINLEKTVKKIKKIILNQVELDEDE